jgi:hypothetical protein
VLLSPIRVGLGLGLVGSEDVKEDWIGVRDESVVVMVPIRVCGESGFGIGMRQG